MLNNFLKLKKKYLSIFNMDFSVEKNWLTINFLKMLYYMSIWMVLFYIFLMNTTLKNYFLFSSFNTMLSDMFLLVDYIWSMKTTPLMNKMEMESLDLLYDINMMQTDALMDCLYISVNDEMDLLWSDMIMLSYDMPLKCLQTFSLLMFMWLLLIGSFLLMHISYGLYQVYNDYMSDLNVLLQKYLTVLSVLILLNILFLFYNNVNIYNDILLNTTMYLYVYKFSLLYIFLFLFMNYMVNKDKKMVLNYLYFFMCSMMCCILFLVGMWYFVNYVLYDFDLSAWFWKAPLFFKWVKFSPEYLILFFIQYISFVLLMPSVVVYLIHEEYLWAYEFWYSLYTVCVEENIMKIMLIIYNFFCN